MIGVSWWLAAQLLASYPMRVNKFRTLCLMSNRLVKILEKEEVVGVSHRKMRKYNIRVEDIMVRDIHFVIVNCKYRDLQDLLDCTKLKHLPLVESADSMILLGSIERSQLQSLIDDQLSRRRRMDYLKEKAQNEKKVDADSHRIINEGIKDVHDSGVRFEVGTEESSFSPTRNGSQKPLKPALKRVPSSSHDIASGTGPLDQTGIALKSLFCVNPMDEPGETHTMFSLLGLNHAYVTSIGKLIGVVALKELRKAIEGSVTSKGVKMRPPLASFRESGNSSSESDTTEIHKLWDRRESLTLPRESSPSDTDDKSH
ncbi:chloride channel protein 2-like [Rhincodon typus]|uniref:chloride channel protein 2-like n=1 Tax=Rhincodon typus TaxID=259920 RepID=UPI002030CF22|nr:chloride channel protein 2-like [Rhincodon typus]